MSNFIKQFLNDESGATAIEYGLIAALIAVVIITAVTLVGTNLKATFNNIAGNLGGTVGNYPPQPRASSVRHSPSVVLAAMW